MSVADVLQKPRRLLLATDLSARCDRPLDRLELLSRDWQAETLALHVLEDAAATATRHTPENVPWRDRPEDARLAAERHVRDCLLGVAGRVATRLEEGAPALVIVRVAQQLDCGLIVTGVARSEWLGRWLLGSTVDRIVQTTAIPVLIVKQRPFGPYRNILVTTDFSESARHALNVALAWFPDARIALLNAYDVPLSGLAADPQRLRDDFRGAIAKDAASFLGAGILSGRNRLHVVLEPGPPGPVVAEYATSHGIDLVVVATHGRSKIFEILIGSSAKQIIGATSCDVLVIRGPDERAA
jgi:nucleotide-binding universal stress UspA family protein